jgi:DNA-binding transcriptional regulator YhcF (GntR family)
MSVDITELGRVDTADPRPESLQIAGLLRAAILTGKYEPGEQLPSQPDMERHFGVARETVKKALAYLKDERLIFSRQGSGSFVRARTERPVELRPHVEAAFDLQDVAIDFAGFSGETLHGALSEPLDKVRAGRVSPRSVKIRLLLPDLDMPSLIPSIARDGSDDPSLRDRAKRIVRRHVEAMAESVRELGELGLVRQASVDVRTYQTTVQFKLYLLNDEELFFGFYPIVQHPISVKDAPRVINDVMGKDATLFHFAASDDNNSLSAEYVSQARKWFDSVWTTVGRVYEV